MYSYLVSMIHYLSTAMKCNNGFMRKQKRTFNSTAKECVKPSKLFVLWYLLGCVDYIISELNLFCQPQTQLLSKSAQNNNKIISDELTLPSGKANEVYRMLPLYIT